MHTLLPISNYYSVLAKTITTQLQNKASRTSWISRNQIWSNIPHSRAFRIACVQYLLRNPAICWSTIFDGADSERKITHHTKKRFTPQMPSLDLGGADGWGWNEFLRKHVESIKHDAGGRLIEISSKSSGTDSLAPEAALRRALVTKKNRYEEVLNYRLIAGGFRRASGRRLHNGRIYVQRGPIKNKNVRGKAAHFAGTFTTVRINNAKPRGVEKISTFSASLFKHSSLRVLRRWNKDWWREEPRWY